MWDFIDYYVNGILPNKFVSLIVGFILGIISGACLMDAYKSGSRWHCSNHQPPHSVSTTDEIGKYTKEHGCKGWTQELK